MLQKVLHTIQSYRMLSPGDKVVVGLSGGADSVALLHILKEIQEGPLDIRLFAAHVNHGIRGEAARNDADFTQTLCSGWGIPFYLEEADIPSLACSLQQSEEEAGRHFRYGFFHKVLEKTGADKIATAHHKNDQAETILHNLIRGTGMQGLTGIQAVNEGIIIRPLLELTKQEILEYLDIHHLPYQEDATNKDSTYTRNRIRNRLIPVLEKDFNPDIVDSLVRMSRILREEEEFLTEYTRDLYRKYSKTLTNKLVFDLKPFLSCHTAIQKRLVRAALRDLRGDLDDVGSSHVEAVIKLAAGSRTGSQTVVPGSEKGDQPVQVKVSYGTLQFQKVKLDMPSAIVDKHLDIPGKVVWEHPEMVITAERWEKNKGLEFSPQCIYIDEDKIKGNLMLRSRKEGDRFQPLGMEGTKKLKDFFIDRKVPAEQRAYVPLLVDEENIIWVAGFQMNHNYRLTDLSRNIVKISIQNHNINGGRIC
ncbi:MAG: tRNA lysidine(34) synthetase TilS [Clostridia bacterium]|nr:tRNA lysidine(34) synthetase TilS [Clostridia bacterium]